MKPFVSIDAQARCPDGRIRPFKLLISEPTRDDSEEAFYCTIVCPVVRDKEMRIFGIDGAQAAELALGFVIRSLEGRYAVLDESGNEVNLRSSPRSYSR